MPVPVGSIVAMNELPPPTVQTPAKPNRARRGVIALVALGALIAIGGIVAFNRHGDSTSEEFSPFIDRDKLSAEEVSIVETGVEAINELPDDIADDITTAFFYEDWPTICTYLDATSDVLETEGVMAVGGDAFRVRDGIFGEVVRWEQRDAFLSECDVDRAMAASDEVFDRD